MPPISVLYATDEHVYVRDPGNFADLVPDAQLVASGTAGVLSGWTLADPSASFAGSVLPGMIVAVVPTTDYPDPPPARYAVSAVSPTSLTLATPGMGLLPTPISGSPPAPGACGYAIKTLLPQIEDASYDLNRLFGIDDAYFDRSAGLLYDARELRQACVLTVLKNLYTSEARTKDGDWAAKAAAARADLDALLDRLNIKWGRSGEAEISTSSWSRRITR